MAAEYLLSKQFKMLDILKPNVSKGAYYDDRNFRGTLYDLTELDAIISLTEQIVTLNDLMVKETICRKTIFPTFIAAQGRMRRDGQIPPAFAEFLLSSVAAKAGQNLETLLWAGDAAAIWGSRNSGCNKCIIWRIQ